MTAFQPVFRLDLPHGRCVAVALPGRAAGDADVPASVLAALPAEERRHVDGLPPLRRAGFVGGRIALRAALADLGFVGAPAAILSTPRGAPALPAVVRGSISHKDGPEAGLAVGLASLASSLSSSSSLSFCDAWHLGVDIERVAPARLDISGHALRPEERVRLPPAGDPRRDEEILFAFSAKEAIYKALDPFVARYVSFGEVAVERRDDGTAAVAFFLRPGEGPFDARVCWLRRDDLILSTARVSLRAAAAVGDQ